MWDTQFGDKFEAVIRDLYDSYMRLSKEWIESNDLKINLKKTTLLDYSNGPDCYKDIKKYLSFLNEKTLDLYIEGHYVFEFKTRVKNINAVEQKIDGYKNREDTSNGRVSVIKCLNDLFGMRIVWKQISLEHKDVDNFMKERLSDIQYKCINSSKNGYKATHIYFRHNDPVYKNKVYPWELQLWNPEDADNNKKSHAKYKQGYTKWEKEVKEAD